MSPAGGGAGLLECAVDYALGEVAAVTPPHLSRPTPCADWDLRMLLRHVNDSLDTLCEAFESGRVEPSAGDGEQATDLVAGMRERAWRMLDAWTDLMRGQSAQHAITIADLPLAAGIVALTGAVEIAVHGWDIAQACGRRQPIPAALAAELLALSPLVVDGVGRRAIFAAPVAASPQAAPGDRLVARLGRIPVRERDTPSRPTGWHRPSHRGICSDA